MAGGRRMHVQKQKTRGSSCLRFPGTAFGCLQSEVIDYRIRLVLFWPCDFRCCNVRALLLAARITLRDRDAAGGDMAESFSQAACVILPLLSSITELIENWQCASCESVVNFQRRSALLFNSQLFTGIDKQALLAITAAITHSPNLDMRKN